MNLAAELLREHSARQAQRLTAYVAAQPSRLHELVNLVSGPPGRLSQLAADVLGWVAERQPQRLAPHLPRLLPLLPEPARHPAVCRGILRALQFVSVPDELQAGVFDYCLGLLGNSAEPAASRVYALTVAARLAGGYPELAAEVLDVLTRALPQAPPSLRVRAAREVPGLRALPPPAN